MASNATRILDVTGDENRVIAAKIYIAAFDAGMAGVEMIKAANAGIKITGIDKAAKAGKQLKELAEEISGFTTGQIASTAATQIIDSAEEISGFTTGQIASTAATQIIDSADIIAAANNAANAEADQIKKASVKKASVNIINAATRAIEAVDAAIPDISTKFADILKQAMDNESLEAAASLAPLGGKRTRRTRRNRKTRRTRRSRKY